MALQKVDTPSTTDTEERLPQPRQPQDLQGLLRFAMEAGSHGSAPSDAPAQSMDPERRRFLEEALSSMTINVTKELATAIDILSKARNPEVSEGPTGQFVEALETISDLVDHVDFANDFYKLGGFHVVYDCLTSTHSEIRLAAADVIAECTQNNPFCQKHAVDMKLLQPLMVMSEDDPNDECKAKAFHAISCIIRDYQPALNQFASYNGFSLILRSLNCNVDKIRVKSAFLLGALIPKNPSIKDCLCDMGYVNQLIAVLNRPHGPEHEHVLNSLIVLLTDNDKALSQCKQQSNIKEMMTNLLNSARGDDSRREETEYLTKILHQLS